MEYENLTNRKLLNEIYEDFNTWIHNNNFIKNDFDRMLKVTKGFIFECVLSDKESSDKVAGQFRAATKDCNIITYDEEWVVPAYTALHFLNRYHRFQLIYLKLIELKLFPVRKLPIDILDYGTGPAHSLFALSDIYQLLKNYGKYKKIERLEKLIFNPDYVELSNSFRNWLHHFTEYVNYINKEQQHFWNVPYHHGSFRNVEGLILQKEKLGIRQRLIKDIVDTYDFYNEDISIGEANYIVDNVETSWKDKYRYNIVTFANFLTKIEKVTDLSNEIRSAAQSLRNGGLLIIVGANNKYYNDIYTKIDEVLAHSSINKVVDRLEMTYNWGSEIGIDIAQYYKELLDKLDEFGSRDKISKDILESLLNRINNINKEDKWTLNVYRKQVKRKKISYRKLKGSIR